MGKKYTKVTELKGYYISGDNVSFCLAKRVNEWGIASSLDDDSVYPDDFFPEVEHILVPVGPEYDPRRWNIKVIVELEEVE